MTLRLLQGLTTRPFGEIDVLHVLQREVMPALREVMRALTVPPATVAWNAGVATHDVSRSATAVLAPLTENSTLTLMNGFDGAEGTFYVVQNATGGWTLDISAPDRLRFLEAPAADIDPDPGPFVVTRYRYHYVTIDGDAALVLSQAVLHET